VDWIDGLRLVKLGLIPVSFIVLFYDASCSTIPTHGAIPDNGEVRQPTAMGMPDHDSGSAAMVITPRFVQSIYYSTSGDTILVQRQFLQIKDIQPFYVQVFIAITCI